jgi:hypothetical protein
MEKLETRPGPLARLLARQAELARREARANAAFEEDLADHIAMLAVRHWRRYGTPLFGTFGGCDVYAAAYGDEVERIHGGAAA